LKKFHGVGCLIAAIAAGLIFAGPAFAANKSKSDKAAEVEPAADPVVLTRSLAGDPGTLDPHRIETVAEASVVDDLFVGLVTDDASARPVAGCAESWTVSPDGLTYTFKLRDDLTWSDGTPLTSADFVYSFRRALDPATAAPQAGLLFGIRNAEAVNKGSMPLDMLGVRAVDPKTLEITLNAPVPYFLEILANPIAYPVPSQVVNRVGREWAKPGVMVNNGPFLLTEREPGGSIRLTRNKAFYDADTIRIDDVVYVPTEDELAALNRYRSGDFDIVTRVPMTRLAWLKENMADELHTAPYLAVYYLVLNTSRAPLDNPKVRQALSYAIDRETLATKLLGSGAVPARGLVPPGTANYKSSFQPDYAKLPMSKRLDMARQLIQQAGYGPSHPLELTLRYVTGDDREKVAVAIASMWRRAGVTTKFQNSESKVHFSAVRAGDFMVSYEGWAADYNDAGDFLFLLRTNSRSANTARYSNPQFDLLMNQADQALTLDARADILKKAEALAMEDQPIIPLLFPVKANLVADYVKGWKDNALDLHPSRYIWLDEPAKDDTNTDNDGPTQEGG
jgi:oligopeptide transport system substrate-binding protein